MSSASEDYRTTEIRFDDGGKEKTTVIGRYRENGQQYHQCVDFSILDVDTLEEITVLLHAHVGALIEPLAGNVDPKIGIRVNEGNWHWRPLNEFMDGNDHWIEFSTYPGEWRRGLNRVSTTSTVCSSGNMTPQSLDILGCSKPPIAMRSWHSHDLERFTPFLDRNWGVRLRYVNKLLPSPKISKLEITPNKEATINQPLQFLVDAYDDQEQRVPVYDVAWSSDSGTIDSGGLFCAHKIGAAVVEAKAGDLVARTSCMVEREETPGVEPPNSIHRLGPQVPPGHSSFCGDWDFRPDSNDLGEKSEWYKTGAFNADGTIWVPGSWQAQGWGLRYHGIGWYRKAFSVPSEWRGRNVWLRFGAASTYAKVWVNGHYIGDHLGNWTDFEFRISDAIKADATNELVVRVEEKPDHISAGFPRVLGQLGGYDSHFGGLWQGVSLFTTAGLHISDVFVSPNHKTAKVSFTITITGQAGAQGTLIARVLDSDGSLVAEQTTDASPQAENSIAKVTLPIPNPKAWSPDSPYLYKACVEVRQGEALSDRREVRFGMRDMTVEGTQILLNGKPIHVRGVLHWGYYPHLFNIDPSEDQIRKEFHDLREAGFNLVKVCLFMFPRRFYEIADETGMLLWQEYPTWMSLPQEGMAADREDIVREYTEWFRFDRNHPSVILRDLTCEADKPDPGLMKRLYELGKTMTDNALLEDNSAYLNQVWTDWYDCHIYRELDDLIYRYLPWLSNVLRTHAQPKPYLTGEDLDADTYRDVEAIKKRWLADKAIPWWFDNDNFRLQEGFEITLRSDYSKDAPRLMVERQKRRALAFRKGCFEELRRYPEIDGFVMTSIRDNPFTRPGFYDDLYEPKWSADDWRRFNGDRVLLLDSERKSFCFRSDETLVFDLSLSNFGDVVQGGSLRWEFCSGSEIVAQGESIVNVERGAVSSISKIQIELPKSLRDTRSPITCQLKATLTVEGEKTQNDWNVWIFPPSNSEEIPTYLYSSLGNAIWTGDLFGVKTIPILPEGKDWLREQTQTVLKIEEALEMPLLTDTLDESVIDFLEAGGRVVYVARDGVEKTLPRHQSALFWRETAIWLPDGHPALGDFPHAGFADRQFLDMTQSRPFDTSAFSDSIDPIVWGTNPRTPGAQYYHYLFQARVGGGKILVCCLNLSGQKNVAGQHLLTRLLKYAHSESFIPLRDMGAHIRR